MNLWVLHPVFYVLEQTLSFPDAALLEHHADSAIIRKVRDESACLRPLSLRWLTATLSPWIEGGES